jgi:hypothetical protein
MNQLDKFVPFPYKSLESVTSRSKTENFLTPSGTVSQSEELSSKSAPGPASLMSAETITELASRSKFTRPSVSNGKVGSSNGRTGTSNVKEGGLMALAALLRPMLTTFVGPPGNTIELAVVMPFFDLFWTGMTNRLSSRLN